MFLKKTIIFLCKLIFSPLSFFIPKKNIIIFQTYSPYIYCENTRHLFEFMSKNSDWLCYWVTENKEIKKYLEKQDLLYLTNKKIIKKIIVSLQAKVVIDSGSDFYNFLGTIGCKTLKITTHHGNGPKLTAPSCETFKETIKELSRYQKFSFVNFTSYYSKYIVAKLNHRVPESKIVTLGYPRCDIFFDKDKLEGSSVEKSLCYQLITSFQKDSKVILYTPTWRPYPYDFPLEKLSGFTWKDFESFLEKESIYFAYTVHSANIPKNLPQSSSRIFYINRDQFPLFDINLFMLECDLLLNDYSTTSTDFALLDKPQVFYMPDFRKMFESKGFIEDYYETLPGPEVKTFEDFCVKIKLALEKPGSFQEGFEEKRKKLLERYYSPDFRAKNASAKAWLSFLESFLS